MVMDQTYNCKEYANGNGPNVTTARSTQMVMDQTYNCKEYAMVMDQTYNCKEYANGNGPNVGLHL